MIFNYKKVIVIGNNGSGKSYFSKKLAQITGLPLIHLDKIYWHENWTHPSREEWINLQENLIKNDKFIIDGMYISTLEIRFREAEAIFFLDIDTKTCIDDAKAREGEVRSDFPKYLNPNEADFVLFLQGIYEFEQKRKPRILELKNKYSSKDFIVFKTRNEIDNYLMELKNDNNSSD